MSVLEPLRCPVCGAPIEPSAYKCEYCDTYFQKPESECEEGITYIYADNKPFAAIPIPCFTNNDVRELFGCRKVVR